MQLSGQKERQIRLGDAAAEGPLGAAPPSERGAEMRRQRGEMIWTSVRQGGFC